MNKFLIPYLHTSQSERGMIRFKDEKSFPLWYIGGFCYVP